jgi:anti-sigma regulatory factor (Ser/Thr protein kinase)
MALDTSFQQEFAIEGGDFNNAGKASSRLKSILKQIGIPSEVTRRVATAAYEAEMNVVIYACRGELSFIVTPREVTIVVEDEGQGIADIDLAMQEGYSTATREIQEMGFGAGMGLPNMERNADELKVESEVGKGTILRMRFII